MLYIFRSVCILHCILCLVKVKSIEPSYSGVPHSQKTIRINILHSFFVSLVIMKGLDHLCVCFFLILFFFFFCLSILKAGHLSIYFSCEWLVASLKNFLDLPGYVFIIRKTLPGCTFTVQWWGVSAQCLSDRAYVSGKHGQENLLFLESLCVQCNKTMWTVLFVWKFVLQKVLLNNTFDRRRPLKRHADFFGHF